jgi:hypothetical protein
VPQNQLKPIPKYSVIPAQAGTQLKIQRDH